MKMQVINSNLYLKLNENANFILLTLSILLLIVLFIVAAVITI